MTVHLYYPSQFKNSSLGSLTSLFQYDRQRCVKLMSQQDFPLFDMGQKIMVYYAPGKATWGCSVLGFLHSVSLFGPLKTYHI